MATQRRSELTYLSPWRRVLDNEHLLRIILINVLQDDPCLLPWQTNQFTAPACEGQPIANGCDQTLHAEAEVAHQMPIYEATLRSRLGGVAADIDPIIHRVRTSKKHDPILDPFLYVDDGSPLVPLGASDSTLLRPVHLDKDGTLPPEEDAAALAALHDSQARLKLSHRSWPTASVAAVCRLWRSTTRDILMQCERRSLQWRRAVVWARMRRRAAARAQLSLDHRMLLDTAVSEAVCDTLQGNKPLRDKLLNVVLPLLDVGASPTAIDDDELGRDNLGDLVDFIFDRETPHSLEWIALLSELTCGAGPGMPWCTNRRYSGNGGTILPEFLLAGLSNGDPWFRGNSFCNNAGRWNSPEIALSPDTLRRRRRCFGAFRTMLFVRTFHAHYAHDTNILFQPYAECFPRRLQDRSILFPDPVKRGGYGRDLHVLDHLIALLIFSPCIDRGTSALVWDTLLTLKLTGFGNLAAHLCTAVAACNNGQDWLSEREFYLPKILRDGLRTSSLLFLRFVRQLQMLHIPTRPSSPSVESKSDNFMYKVLETALHCAISAAVGRKSGQRHVRMILGEFPEVAALVIEQMPNVVLKVCRMRRRRLLGALLRAQPERMRALAPQLLADMRTPTVRGLKHNIIEMLERHVENMALDKRTDE